MSLFIVLTISYSLFLLTTLLSLELLRDEDGVDELFDLLILLISSGSFFSTDLENFSSGSFKVPLSNPPTLDELISTGWNSSA
jgi:hypothetical protein